MSINRLYLMLVKSAIIRSSTGSSKWVSHIAIYESKGKEMDWIVGQHIGQGTAGSGWHTAFETLQQIQRTHCPLVARISLISSEQLGVSQRL